MFPKEANNVKFDDLRPILSGGATFASIYRLFYYTRLLRAVERSQFKTISSEFTKIATKSRLSLLCKLGYFKEVSNGVYIAKNKCLGVLQQAGYLTKFLPHETESEGGINQLENTKALIDCLKLPDYYTLLFPNFKYLIPDALLVRKKEDKYKLTFLEIEKKKGNWDNYLLTKRDNYLRLAKDINVYNYWKDTVSHIGLTMPSIKDFSFDVTFIGSIKKDFGKGFIFLSYEKS